MQLYFPKTFFVCVPFTNLIYNCIFSIRFNATVQTFLEKLEVLPEDIPHEGRGAGQEGVTSHAYQVPPLHLELLHRHALQAEVLDGPHEPLSHVIL